MPSFALKLFSKFHLFKGKCDLNAHLNLRNNVRKNILHWVSNEIKRLAVTDQNYVSSQIQDAKGDVTITNDGATILKQMQVLHPAAKMVSVFSSSWFSDSDKHESLTSGTGNHSNISRVFEEHYPWVIEQEILRSVLQE